MSTVCSGRTPRSFIMSIESSAWLVTMMSASRALARAASAKQSGPWAQSFAPTHSEEVVDAWRQARSLTPGSRSSRSPVSVSFAQS